MSFEVMKREFREPGNEYRFAPFWFLNHELEDEELAWQIQEMHRMGVGGFVLHARHGLITPYLSGEWLGRIECCIREAERLGMKAYLYDENNWPSGPADGKAWADNPEYRMSGVYLAQQFDIRGPKKLEEQLEVRDGLVGVVAVPYEDEKIVDFPERALNLAEFASDNWLSWQAPAGSWRVLVFARRFLVGMFFGGYLDTMNKDAVAKFIELTHKAYAERFEGYFGSVVRGIFTDEPALNHNPPDCIPWTPKLPSEFEWRYGYDLIKVLPALFMDVGSETSKIRCDFYDTAVYLYQEAYFKQIYDFCDLIRLNTVGHVNAEGELLHQIRCQGDFFRGAEYMHFGGVDYLCEVTWPETIGGHNTLAGMKFASSAAHLLEKPAVMNECFGLASQWAISLGTLKWLTDWAVVLGSNVLVPHAFYYSIQGFRKWECPPGEFYQSPFWPYYKVFADYAGRLCNLFTGGRHIADVALLYPVKSMWAAIDPSGNTTVNKLIAGFEKVSTALLRINHDFDYISEEMLQEAGFDEGVLEVWGENLDILETYKVLVIPTVTTISTETAETLYDFYEVGGKIVATGSLPNNSAERGKDELLAEYLCDLFGVRMEEAVLKVDKPMEVRIYRRSNEKGGEAVFVAGLQDAPQEEVNKVLNQVLKELITPDVTVTEKGEPVGDIVHLHHLKDDLHLFFFANTSRGNSYAAEITLDLVGVPQVWDAITGEVVPLYYYEVKADKLCIPLRFELTQSYVISVDTKADVAAYSHVTDTNLDEILEVGLNLAKGVASTAGSYFIKLLKGKERKTLRNDVKKALGVIKLGDEWGFKTDRLNALPLREWKYLMESKVLGRDGCSGWHIYEAKVDAEYKPREARLLVDGLVVEKIWKRSAPVDVKIMVNGQAVTEFQRGEYLDHYIWEADVAKLLRRGENTVTVRTEGHLYEIPQLSHPIILVGDFGLEERDNKWVLVKPVGWLGMGSWTEQGYPFYSGIGIYEQTVRIPQSHCANKVRLFLKLENVGDLADVWVNDKQVRVLISAPFEADITEFVKAGENVITIKVANSLQNLLLQDLKPSGLLGAVEIVPKYEVEFKL